MRKLILKTAVTIALIAGTISYSQAQTAKDYVKSGDKKLKVEDFSGAIEEYTQAIKLDPNNAEMYYSRGMAYQ